MVDGVLFWVRLQRKANAGGVVTLVAVAVADDVVVDDVVDDV